MKALPLSLPDLLHGRTVEWERLEFKAGWNRLDVLHTLCAFANDFHNLGGGYLVLGVAEQDGRPVLPPVGLDAATLDGIQKELLNLGNSAIQPPYHPIAVPAEVDGRHILVLWAPGGQSRPYRARTSLAKDSRDYAWFIRKGSSTVKARGTDETELLGLAATVLLHDRCDPQTSVDDLDRDLMVALLREVGSDLADEAPRLSLVELGRQMHVVGGTSEALLTLNVGLMFLPPAVALVPAHSGRRGVVPGRARRRPIHRGGLPRPLHRLMREALDHIRCNDIDETVTKHTDRAEATQVENFPFEAVEEAIVHAL